MEKRHGAIKRRERPGGLLSYILRQTRGVIEGPRGAAKLLEMTPSTVRFRMKKPGISKVDYLV